MYLRLSAMSAGTGSFGVNVPNADHLEVLNFKYCTQHREELSPEEIEKW